MIDSHCHLDPQYFSADLQEVLQTVQATLENVRSLSQALHPVMLDEAGLEGQRLYDGTQDPEVKAKLALQGLYPVGMCGDEFAAYIRKRFDDYGEMIKESNIKAQ